ncbi:redoxin domain-containing protein [Jiangella mangrovi]|uniref:Thiol-disulfide isomerase/thioredoxin n=1 Tax=Jiangella mangrovi TaxID=1524084 RepID=A0A7W9GWT3_9ACTN|nr:redoxin domain-containing protein [Jiangella mangrovi]MBB5791213.1 thiol-disulfide isomerase/thioredoxin [Jiangella mangrovi]
MSARRQLPALDGAVAWIGSAPLRPADLHGHVVLVNFWTLTCINWLRTAPYVRAWARAYRDDGLVVVGVHTPEFSFEHDGDRVRRATARRSIEYPVAVDSDYRIWSAFDNHYWPALYFADTGGLVRDQHFGEGRYAWSERLLQKLLGVERELVTVAGEGDEAEADWDRLRTGETYLGSWRGERRADVPPERLRHQQWTLRGEWTVGGECVVLGAPGGSVAIRFHARDAHLVLSPGAGGGPVRFRVLLDGAAPGPSHGADVDADGNGIVDDGRMYQLVRVHDGVRERTVEVVFLDAGAEAYAFTFG